MSTESDDKLTATLARLRAAQVGHPSDGMQDVIAIAEVLQETRAILAAMMGPVTVYDVRTFDDRRPLDDSRDQIRAFVEKHLPKTP